MKNTYLIFITLLITSLTSCFDDKGNYDYENPEENVIGNIENDYHLISFKDSLVIVPELEGINENENTTYLWTIYSSGSTKESEAITQEKRLGIRSKVLSEERNLNFKINLSTGTYRINYEVKDGITGLTSLASTYLTVNTEFTKGFYILKETSEGNSEIDIYTSENSLLENLISNVSGTTLEGSPLTFGLWPRFSYLDTTSGDLDTKNFLLPITKKGKLAMIRTEDFKQIRNLEEMFYKGVDPGKPIFAYANAENYNVVTSSGYFSNGQVANVGIVSSGYFGRVSTLPEEPSNYEFSQFACLYGKGALLYDNLHHRFIESDFVIGNLHLISDQDAQYKANNIEDELVYIGGGSLSNKDYAFAIFNKKNSQQKRVYSFGQIDLTKYTNTIDDIVDIPLNSAMTQANIFACSKKYAKLIYYVSNNKIYVYKFISRTEKELTFEGLPQDEEITYLENIYSSVSEDVKFHHLIVGTYKDGNYSIYMYNTLGGLPLDGPQKIIKGKGKVVKLQYLNSGIDNHENKRFDNMYSLQY